MENKNPQKEGEEILDSLAEEITNLTDEEISKLYKEATLNPNPDEGVTNIRVAALTTINALRRKELREARTSYERTALVKQKSRGARIPENLGAQRKLLESLWNNPQIPQALTMSFRDKKDLSDNDVTSILEDLEELGFLEES
jgi:hypothetical protein